MVNVIGVETVAHIVGSIFSTMMDIEISIVDATWPPAGERIAAYVYLEGTWNGAVSLECDRGQACQFAGKFLGLDEPPQAVDDDVRDALGELANMIGGNIKAVMPSGVQLSLPSVIEGSNYKVRICGSDVQDKIAFGFAGGTFWVTIVARDEDCTHKSEHHAVHPRAIQGEACHSS